MNIKVIDLIREALVGGRNGEMAYIYNNPFMFELFNQWKNKEENYQLHKNDEDVAFREFLKACLKEDIVESKTETPQVIGYKTLTKEYNLYPTDKDYKEWKTLETEIQSKRKEQMDLVQAMAKKRNESLAEISVVKMQDSFSGKKIVFEFSVEAILNEKAKEEGK